MSDDLQRRLRRLGVKKGTRHLKPAPPVSPQSEIEPESTDGEEILTLETIMPGGQVLETSAGSCFVIDYVLPFSYEYGRHSVEACRHIDLPLFAQLTQDPRLVDFAPTDLLFLDIETRGLMQTGAEVIQIGLAFFEENGFVIRFLFARDLEEEGALLAEVDRLASRFPVLVTFNGKAFDLRFLDGRAILNRLSYADGDLRDRPHIDLLPLTRRLWKHLPSVALNQIDQHVLKGERVGQDIPGWQVPMIYNRYLVDRDPRPLVKIFDHNRFDMLAMMALIVEIDQIWRHTDQITDSNLLFNLARQQIAIKQYKAAEHLFQSLVSRQQQSAERALLLKEYSIFLKRQERRSEAVVLWEELAVLKVDSDSIFPHIELAKYYEWHAVELRRAAEWAAHAYQIVISQRFINEGLKAEIEHRLIRLAQKQDKLRSIDD